MERGIRASARPKPEYWSVVGLTASPSCLFLLFSSTTMHTALYCTAFHALQAVRQLGSQLTASPSCLFSCMTMHTAYCCTAFHNLQAVRQPGSWMGPASCLCDHTNCCTAFAPCKLYGSSAIG